MDKRVEAIRKHPKVGRWSCSWIDECLSDQELIDELDGAGATTVTKAVRWAVREHDLWEELQKVRESECW